MVEASMTTPFPEPGVSAFDDVDRDVTGRIVVVIPVDMTLLDRVQMMRYSVTDAAGNTATADRQVQVIDTTPPTLVLQKPSPDLAAVDESG